MNEQKIKHKEKPATATLKPASLISQIMLKNPKLMDGLSESRATTLLECAFKQIRETLNRTSEGIVSIGGFGNFRIIQIKKEVEGKSVLRTQIVYKPGGNNKGKATN